MGGGGGEVEGGEGKRISDGTILKRAVVRWGGGRYHLVERRVGGEIVIQDINDE